ncbi:3-carboxy-cis,cis-muconate cycloisomerase [Pelagibius litoralis]|uniref:3-carboxy-cis,cis-muconate cycloisomerase n=1 Tax=Pelagibius litoralis TaxID=374515 RepID=A0A967KD24_9PROT|nr:3-carboxy-cis,cis-muconate cycloisomerase [Pelagibius litoralis]NIA69990.1 3-carboxy-cis,cis-muconate cycloisomerase [Pelagibius litoralis]
MSALPFDSVLYGALLSDAESIALLDDTAQLRAMLDFEAALAEAGGDCAAIPESAALRIAEVARTFDPDPAELTEATARDGIPIPALVAALREAVGGEAASFVHWGATSQDVMDTALLLRLCKILDIFDKRLVAVCGKLATTAAAEGDTVMVARTRGQQATPTTFGLKVAGWLAPLQRHRERLDELRPRLEVLSFGGASGTLSALGERAAAKVETALAARLDLAVPALPWHNQRDGLIELSSWLALVTGSLGKIAGDVLLLSQSEVGEVREGAGGGSSTMPQKANPVRSEAILALARLNAGLAGQMQATALHNQERDGAAWQQEWLVLPQMLLACGSALNHINGLLEALQVNAERMRANLEAANGLVLAEAASFALSRHLPREDAQALVKQACKEVSASGRHLFDILAAASDAPVDWQALRDPAQHAGMSRQFIERVLRRGK